MEQTDLELRRRTYGFLVERGLALKKSEGHREANGSRRVVLEPSGKLGALRAVLFTALFGFAFIHNIVSGPTCIVRLQTAVQTHRFAPLERTRDFRKGMQTIVPLIQNAQSAVFQGRPF